MCLPGETPTSVGLPESGVINTKKAWGSVSRWWLYLLVSQEMGHFCKRLLFVQTYGVAVGFFCWLLQKVAPINAGNVHFYTN